MAKHLETCMGFVHARLRANVSKSRQAGVGQAGARGVAVLVRKCAACAKVYLGRPGGIPATVRAFDDVAGVNGVGAHGCYRAGGDFSKHR